MIRDFAANRRFTFCRHKYQWVENDSVKIQEYKRVVGKILTLFFSLEK